MIFVCLPFSSSCLTYQYLYSIYFVGFLTVLKSQQKKITTFLLQMNRTTHLIVQYTYRIKYNILWRCKLRKQCLSSQEGEGRRMQFAPLQPPVDQFLEKHLTSPPTDITALASEVLGNKWTSGYKIFLIQKIKKQP